MAIEVVLRDFDGTKTIYPTELLQPHIMIRIGRIPVECACHGPARNAQPNNIGAVRSLLSVNLHTVIHGRIRRDHDRAG
jgi:hypothetical protein